MKINRISKGEMPPEGKYVLIYIDTDLWISGDDPYGVHWKVARCVYGISKEEREKLRHSKNDSDRLRAGMYYDFDENGNSFSNLKPYAFYEFGSIYHCGQNVDLWCELPDVKEMIENEI